MSTLRSFTRISAFNLEGAWTGFSWMFFGRVICARQFWTMSHILSWAKSERSIMSISTCPQPSGRLLALWLFAKHQQEGAALAHFHGERGGRRRPIMAEGLDVHRPGAGFLVPPGEPRPVSTQARRTASSPSRKAITPRGSQAFFSSAATTVPATMCKAPPEGSLPPAASLLSSSAEVQVLADKISPRSSGVYALDTVCSW